MLLFDEGQSPSNNNNTFSHSFQFRKRNILIASFPNTSRITYGSHGCTLSNTIPPTTTLHALEKLPPTSLSAPCHVARRLRSGSRVLWNWKIQADFHFYFLSSGRKKKAEKKERTKNKENIKKRRENFVFFLFHFPISFQFFSGLIR